MANVDDGNETLLQTLRRWLKNPSNWLALSSIAISVATFLYVRFYPHSVMIYMPKQIAITAPAGRAWRFAVNASLFNESPSNKFLIIEDATLNFRIATADPSLSCPWDGTSELVPSEEYESRYGKLPEASKKYRDQITPPQRKLPFIIRGQELQTKLLIFICPPGKTEPASGSADPIRVETTLKIMTPKKTYTSKLRGYQLFEKIRSETEDGSWRWMDRLDS